ncbi:MAG: type III pantothenate kinase [Xanthomonadales bacterium]|nr:type III pantothenate kinase [Xanthomonadales bacterium]
MILCLDIGNSHIYGGVFEQNKLLLQFRKSSKTGASSDEYGLFLRGVLRENNIDPASILHIAICNVVPEVQYPISAASRKYFNITPFILQAGVKTGLKIRYRNPLEVGADRIANAIAATTLYPGEDVIIIDLGTATTFCLVTSDKSYQGGVILPGLKLSMVALSSGASRLGSVEIVGRGNCLGKATSESIQSGLYNGHLGAMREIIQQIQQQELSGKPVRVIGTGGFTTLFAEEQIFDDIVPDLVLKGLFIAQKLNLD